jgi:hypothetical protein
MHIVGGSNEAEIQKSLNTIESIASVMTAWIDFAFGLYIMITKQICTKEALQAIDGPMSRHGAQVEYSAMNLISRHCFIIFVYYYQVYPGDNLS